MTPTLCSLAMGLFLGATAPEARDVLREIEAVHQKLFDQVAPSVAFIRSSEGFGSGFFVGQDGLILTNNHVVKDCKTVDVVLHDGRALKGTVVERALENVDLALVRVPSPRVPAAQLSGVKGLQVGSWVGSIGHGGGAVWTFNTGMVSNVYIDGSERPVFQTQIPLNPGNSGGPIFDRHGRVVGIVTAGITQANAINFSISMDLAFRTLPSLAAAADLLLILAPPGVPVFVNDVMAGKGPRVVVAAKKGASYAVFAVVDGQIVRAEAKFPEVREVALKR